MSAQGAVKLLADLPSTTSHFLRGDDSDPLDATALTSPQFCCMAAQAAYDTVEKVQTPGGRHAGTGTAVFRLSALQNTIWRHVRTSGERRRQ
jgi:hypothetical protein